MRDTQVRLRRENGSGPRHCGYGIPLPRELDWPHVHVVLKFQRFKHGSTHLHRGKLAAKAGSICGRRVQNTVGTEMARRLGHSLTNTGKVAFRPTQAETRSRKIVTGSRSGRDLQRSMEL